MSNHLSPLTGVIDETEVIIEFGEFEGRTVREVHDLSPETYRQLVQEKEHDNIAIRRNRDKTFKLYMNPLLAKTGSA